MALYNYIAIEGVIGVGKTTLAEAIAGEFGGQLVEERFEENPFLPDFYKDPEKYAFSTQIFFLLSRYRQLSELHSYDLFHDIVVTDYIFEKDKIFAYINLTEAELRLYEEVERHLAAELPRPNLVVYLQASVNSLIRRIKNRGRPFEKRITEGYIEQLVKAYNYFFFEYKSSPLLVVNTDNLDLTDGETFVALSERISRPIRGTEYYTHDRTLWG
ncbi:deoxynucleoside kinase [bacterium]|nr:MAG: deoxynucleoside kinase [bacterium]